MTVLDELKKNYEQSASAIKGWQTANKNDLINAYIDHKDDDVLRNQYFSAIILRYWNNIYKYYETSKKSVEIEECYEWLVEAIYYILDTMHKWRDPKDKYHNDPNAPDKFINMSIYSARQYFYQATNTSKRAANFNCSSIDEQSEVWGDSSKVSKALAIEEDKLSPLRALIKGLFDKGAGIKALIIDAICYQDSLKIEKSRVTHTVQIRNKNGEEEDVEEKFFNYKYTLTNRQVVKSLRSIKLNYEIYLNYFMKEYKITKDVLDQSLQYLDSINNESLYVIIRKTLYELKMDKEAKSIYVS